MENAGQSPDEIFDVYTEEGLLAGTARRADVHAQGLWHRSAQIWIARPDRSLLLQKRSSFKDVFPNCWDVSCAGHINAGEEPLAAAVRELQEELGLNIAPERLAPLFTLRKSFTFGSLQDNEINHVFMLQLDDAEVPVPEPSEISELRWIEAATLPAIAAEEPSLFVPHGVHYQMASRAICQSIIT
jgi:isopentenyl-diphosphate Delta-isomerase